MLNQEQIYAKWWEIKGGIRNIWGELTEEEIDSNKGDLDAIAGLVHQKFGEDRHDIKEKMDALMQSFDNETDKTDFYQSSYARSPLGPNQGATSDIAPGMEGATTHKNYHVRHDASGVGNKNVQDFDSDRNARH